MPQIVSNQTVNSTDIGIDSNGRYQAFVSSEFSSNNNKAVEATLQIKELLPNRTGLGRARVMFMMERKDDGGNWHPVHGLYGPVIAISYDSTENGGIIPDQQLSYGPNVFNFDGQVSIDTSDGENIILQDHQKRGVMPSKFRFVVVIHENDFGGVGAFASMTFSIDYELHPE